jgi:glycosyltransferase involved in cell wall biosynthesis
MNRGFDLGDRAILGVLTFTRLDRGVGDSLRFPIVEEDDSAFRRFSQEGIAMAVATIGQGTVMIACPDARPPAYQAVVGLAQRDLLESFHTAYYHRSPRNSASRFARIAPRTIERIDRLSMRRHDPEIPSDRVRIHAEYDLALAAENRLAGRHPAARRELARLRTRRFDRVVASNLERSRPDVLLTFSDVGSEFALPKCVELGIGSIVSVVCGEPSEERAIMEIEAETSPDFFPIYLGGAPIDRIELDRLHARRVRDVELADRVLVPSRHLADRLIDRGAASEKITIVPYAADTRRFRPQVDKEYSNETCTFLFAGGICQRKGIKYLLEAWRRIRRPGLRLLMLGALPLDKAPLEPYRDLAEWPGRVSHSEVAGVMAEADVFVFPSLFEGSAVVTYEALACGLPSIVTPNAGSIVRDGIEGFVVPPRDVDALAAAMERVSRDSNLREHMAKQARSRAELFDWPRYHASIVAETSGLIERRSRFD